MNISVVENYGQESGWDLFHHRVQLHTDSIPLSNNPEHSGTFRMIHDFLI
jgi:hypothetical protein